MLQCPFISTIVFKDLDVKLGHIATTNSTYTQVTLSLMDGTFRTTWAKNFPPCLSLHIHSKYLRVKAWLPHNVQTIVKKHIWLSVKCHISMLAPFRFLIDPCYRLRWVDIHTYALNVLLLHKFNHMEMRGGCWIEPQSSLTKSMDARWQYPQILGCQIANDVAGSSRASTHKHRTRPLQQSKTTTLSMG